MKIVGWTSYDSNCQGICLEDRQTMIEALNETLRAICENGYLFSGERHQNASCCVPVFDNGKCLRCSMRGWAMLMSIAHTGEEDSYMDYYMDQFITDEKLPREEVGEEAFVIDQDYEGTPFYYANQDLELAAQSARAGMPLMTFDPVVTFLYDVMVKLLQND